MERRTVPGSSLSVSVLGIAVGAICERLPAPHAAANLPGLLRFAAGEGVTVFDATGGSSTPVAERAIASAFPERGTERVVLSSPERPLLDAASVRVAAEESRRRLNGRRLELLWVPPGVAADPGLASSLEQLVEEDLLGGWGVESRPARGEGTTPDSGHGLGGTGPVRTRYSLLEPDPARARLAECAEQHRAAFIEDPHAAGRLDGSEVGEGMPLTPRRPAPVRELAERFAPVLRLEFLVGKRVRTLPQAAVQYALAGPAVTSVLLAPRGPAELAEMVAALECPPLTEREIDRVRALGAPGRP